MVAATVPLTDVDGALYEMDGPSPPAASVNIAAPVTLERPLPGTYSQPGGNASVMARLSL